MLNLPSRRALRSDNDDLFCDESPHRVYASYGEGYIDIVDTLNIDGGFVRGTLKTASKPVLVFGR